MKPPSVTAYMRIRRALRDRGRLLVETSGGHLQGICTGPEHPTAPYLLNVTAIEGMALVHCFGGCSTAQVMGPLGMDARHLYDRPGYATYVYTDVNGIPTRLVHKRIAADGSKSFHQTFATVTA